MDTLLNENKTLMQNNRTLIQQNNSLQYVNKSMTQEICQLRQTLERLNKETREYQEMFQQSERNNMDLRRQLRSPCQKCCNKNNL